MATITINLLDTKRTVLSKNNQVYLSAPNSDYLMIAGESSATDFAVLYNEIYNEYVFTVTMVNSKGEGIQFELVDDAFALESNMTVAGYTKIYITATNGTETVAWERIDIKISSTSPDYVALTENSMEFVRYNLQTLTEAQKTQVRNNINAASKDDIRVEKYAFETYDNFIDWLGGTYTRADGILPTDLFVGDEILLVETDKPDYWLKSKSTPITIVDFAITETDLSNYLAKDNTTEYTPTGNYNPATKLYVDEKVAPLELHQTEVESVYTYDNAENRASILLFAENPEKYNLMLDPSSGGAGATVYKFSLLSYTDLNAGITPSYIFLFKDVFTNSIYRLTYDILSDTITVTIKEYENKTYTTTLPTTSGGESDWQAVTGGYELAKTISGLTVYDSIVSVADDDTIWTDNELNATITTDTLTFFVSSLPSEEVELNLTITKSINGGEI